MMIWKVLQESLEVWLKFINLANFALTAFDLTTFENAMAKSKWKAVMKK